MLENARELIEKYALGKVVAAAVSGGPDSMALFTLLREYHECGKLTLKCVNVDHCIRENSARDSEFVRELCKKSCVEFIGERIDIPRLSAESGRGLESEAHFARREFFDRVISSGIADMVVTAHHRRDNAETVLLHLFRGSGVNGLSGMKLFSRGVFRPFLYTAKEEIDAFIENEKIPFVVDETNLNSEYDRNYIRREVLPVIAARFPWAERSIERAALLSAETEKTLRESLDERAFSLIGGAVTLDEKYLTPPYIFEALRRAGKERDVYYAAITAVMGLKTASPCARVDIGGGFAAAREYGVVAFYERKEGANEVYCETDLSNDEVVLPAGSIYAHIRKSSRVEFEQNKTSPSIKFFDADALASKKIVLRNRREGDRFTPFGGGSRKLKEYLIDKKIPLRLRDSLVLLCEGSEVYAVVGLEISDKIKVTDKSERIYAVYTEERDEED